MNTGLRAFQPLMHSLSKKRLLISSLFLVICLIISGVIFTLPRPRAVDAQGSTTPSIQILPDTQAYYAGTTIKVLGSHFTKDTSVSVYWDYTKTKTLEFTANVQNGSFVNSFPMPLAPTDIYTIAAVGHPSDVVVTASFHLLPNLYALPRATGVGSLFNLTGQAFGAGEIVNLYWNCSGSCTGTPPITATADQNGSFRVVSARIPPAPTTTYGKNYITGIGQSSGMSDTTKIIVYQPTLALAPLSGAADTQLTLTAYGFQSNETLKAYWNNGTTPIFTSQATTNGYLQATTYTVPAGTSPGSYSVKVKGSSSKLSITSTFTVVAPKSSLSTISGPQGARVRISGQGYAPGETVNVVWGYGSQQIQTVAAIQASLSGTFGGSFIVPAMTNGPYTIAAVGASSTSVTTNTFTLVAGQTTNPATFSPGQSTTVTASGFHAGEMVNFYWDNTSGSPLGSGNANANGAINQAVTSPAGTTSGSHTIIGVGQSSGISFTTPITIDTQWSDFGFTTPHLRENTFENRISPSTVANLQQKWTASLGTPLPEGAPSPIYSNGTVYIAGFNGVLSAYDTSGNVKWQFDSKTNFANLSSPVADPVTGMVFFGTLGFLEDQDHGVPSPFYALDSQGNLIWELIVPGDDYAFPTLAFNTIYVGMANEGNGSLLAIDEMTGNLLRQYKAGGGTWGAVGVDTQNHTIFTGVGNPGDKVLAFDATAFNNKSITSISPLWTYNVVSPGKDDDVGTGLAVANGIVYVDSKNGNMYAVYESGVEAGTLAWETKIGAQSIGNVSSPVVSAAGEVYVGSLNNNLYALNATTGVVSWKTSLGGNLYSSPALANGVVYVASNNGNLYALDTTGNILWQHALYSSTATTTFSSPIVVNGWVYCASDDGNLYAFSL